MLTHKKQKKAFYRKVLAARFDLLNNPRIFKFKKKKWRRFKFFAKLRLKYFKRYRFRDQARMYVNKFASRGNSFKKSFRNYMGRAKGIQLMYGGFKKKCFKRVISAKQPENRKRVMQNDNINTLLQFEKRVDSVLYKTHFCKTIRQAQQMVHHGHVKLNGCGIRIPSVKLKFKDQISISQKSKMKDIVRTNLMSSKFWPTPPPYLKVNYRTLHVINISNDRTREIFFARFNLRIDVVKNNARFK